MAETLRIIEDAPIARADGVAPVEGVSSEAVWERLEAWCNHRWGVRKAVFLVEGGGVWAPRLHPATLIEAEIWEAGAWAPCALAAHPLGYDLPRAALRLSFWVGETIASAAVAEAFKRLGEYMAADQAFDVPGASSVSTVIGSYTKSWRRSPSWKGRALELSGAADLLRPYRHAGFL